MNRGTLFIIALFMGSMLSMEATAFGDTLSYNSRDSEHAIGGGTMAMDQYNRSVQNNRRQIRSAAESLLVDGLGMVGLSEGVTRNTLSAVGAAVRGGTISLNEEKSLYIELDEPVGNEPAASLRYRLSW